MQACKRLQKSNRHPVKAATLFVALLLACAGATAKTERSHKVRHAFVKEQACPSTGKHRLPCPGWQIDHIQPLKCNGPDAIPNLQWLTVEDHKAKTKREAKECR
jgi:5-methylcytosine-specific restriction endonuclease McrA